MVIRRGARKQTQNLLYCRDNCRLYIADTLLGMMAPRHRTSHLTIELDHRARIMERAITKARPRPHSHDHTAPRTLGSRNRSLRLSVSLDRGIVGVIINSPIIGGSSIVLRSQLL